MTVKHHLTDELLMAYSAGDLPEAVNLIVATHISLCDECRAALGSYDAVGGAVLDSCDTVEMSKNSLNSVLDMIHAQDSQVQDKPASTKVQDDVLPAPLIDYIGGGLDSVRWRAAGMGVKQAILPTSKDATARLLYIPAGTAIPDHGHHGLELTLVLKGAFQDEGGYFGRGDIEVASEDLNHTPVADISEDCICLAVTDAPLKFKGLMPRIAQPFLGI
ncbi:ChrR family anti-sigma-E factor [Marivita sp. XM-24bin2]|jgi:putative transcriptional regulator|uniref:ChrR family anti-sigma-E factor n=1 Tax=unclassified Marivita TaxID=2632480 RepID=UPI000D7B9120|nr:ChrR family anti-sigma-E factor [Marivita sp. XM-24bin2]MCR9108447.1 ChrR family anti-sigma-E factor [Paracoccaceae bacterium]PWL34397.1 MAG: transcriptional regulator [Marivita sp. XM-24bin2]